MLPSASMYGIRSVPDTWISPYAELMLSLWIKTTSFRLTGVEIAIYIIPSQINRRTSKNFKGTSYDSIEPVSFVSTTTGGGGMTTSF